MMIRQVEETVLCCLARTNYPSKTDSLFICQENLLLGGVVHKLLRLPCNTSSMNQATQIEPDWKKRSQISLRQQALFHRDKSLIPSPPSFFDFVTASHETLAVL
ncbi:unnamed protein product [Brassica oleracea var. botrytis]